MSRGGEITLEICEFVIVFPLSKGYRFTIIMN